MMTVIYTLLFLLSSPFFARLVIILLALLSDRPSCYPSSAHSIGHLTASSFDFSCRGESYTPTRPTRFLSPTPVARRIAHQFRSPANGATNGAAAQRFARGIIRPHKERTHERIARPPRQRIDARPAQQPERRTRDRFAHYPHTKTEANGGESAKNRETGRAVNKG